MKKLLYTIAAFAAVTMAASCAREMEVSQVNGEGLTATFTVAAPGVATKTLSDGSGATDLKFGVYDESGNYLEGLTTAAQISTSGSPWTVTVPVVSGLSYQFVFVAQKPNNTVYTVDLANKKLSRTTTNVVASSDDADIFYAATAVIPITGNYSAPIDLVRPLAQINFGAPAADITAAALSMRDITTKVKVTGVYSGINLLTGAVEGDAVDVVSDLAAMPQDDFTDGFKRVAMLYAIVADNQPVVNAELTVQYNLVNEATTAEPRTITRSVANVPLKRNYRTNVLGNIFTGTATFTVTTQPGFAVPEDTYGDYTPEYSSITALNEDFALGKGIGYQVAVTAIADGGETIYLPSTADDVRLFFRGDFSTKSVDIQYSTAANAEKPGNLYIKAPKLGTLSGTIGDTHVEIETGSEITNGNLSTSNGTLVIQKLAKIINLIIAKGSLKVDSEGEVTTATIQLPATEGGNVTNNGTIIHLNIEQGEVNLHGQYAEVNANGGSTNVAAGASVETLKIDNTDGDVDVVIDSEAGVMNIQNDASAPVTIKNEDGVALFYVGTLTELQDAITAEKTNIFYNGAVINEKVTLAPTVATQISGVKIDFNSSSDAGPVLSINGDIKLTASVNTNAKCVAEIAAGHEVTLVGCEFVTEGYSSSDARALNINGSGVSSRKKVTIKNSTLKATASNAYCRGINPLGDGCEIEVVNTVIEVPQYAINLVSSTTNAIITVEQSTITGWCITNIWNTGNVVTLKNSKLYSINKYSGTSNAFGTFVFNAGTSTVNVVDCDVVVSATGDQAQYLGMFKVDGNTLNFKGNTTITANDPKNYYENAGTDDNGNPVNLWIVNWWPGYKAYTVTYDETVTFLGDWDSDEAYIW